MAGRSAIAAARPGSAGSEEREQVVDLPARMTVSLPGRVWNALEQSAKRDCISKAEALRRAVWIYLHFMDRVRSGCEIVVERPDGNSERVIFPY